MFKRKRTSEKANWLLLDEYNGGKKDDYTSNWPFYLAFFARQK